MSDKKQVNFTTQSNTWKLTPQAQLKEQPPQPPDSNIGNVDPHHQPLQGEEIKGGGGGGGGGEIEDLPPPLR